jgi:hypothetical protein
MRTYIALVILLSSCHGSPLIDTTRSATEFAPWEECIEFPIYYIGPVKDTIPIGRQYWLGRTPGPPFPYKAPISRHYTNRNLTITVDTSWLLTRTVEYLSKDGNVLWDSTKSYYAYLLTIKNISDSLVFLGRTFSVYYLHMEIKDTDGHWIKATRELSEIGLCLTNQPGIFLKPGEMILSKVPLLKGTSPVEARLAFGSRSGSPVYSNTFRLD